MFIVLLSYLKDYFSKVYVIYSQNMDDRTYFISHIDIREYKFRVEFYRVIYFLGFKTGFAVDFIGNFKTLDEAKNCINALKSPIILKNL